MSHYIVMIPSDTAGASLGSPAYGTVEDALQGAKFILSIGAVSAWIVDENGLIILPTEQVVLRLGEQPEPHHLLADDKCGETHDFRSIPPM